jgi:protocatechuate 3,4-dioxygenase beta subunit
VRGTLLARRAGGDSPKLYRFDIVMQGENETAFLDI